MTALLVLAGWTLGAAGTVSYFHKLTGIFPRDYMVLAWPILLWIVLVSKLAASLDSNEKGAA